jgi:predicted TPR repeat methyltransferase
MLQKAEGKGCYDHLYRIELGAFLAMPDEAAAWDVILSADTLCYFGPLEAVAAGARALRPGGLFGFSVEDAGDRAPDGHLLNPHGRYAHSAAYVRALPGGRRLYGARARPGGAAHRRGQAVHGLPCPRRPRAAWAMIQ